MKISFEKYQGTGNDFIMVDGRNHELKELTQTAIYSMCHRRFGIGADGLIILKNKDGFDFEMDYYNADGHRGSMCGNGGRCTIAFAYDLGIINDKTKFYAPDGEHEAVYKNKTDILLKMNNVNQITTAKEGLVMDTGSPHLVVLKENFDSLNIYEEGRTIRYNATYNKDGINVNFLANHDKFVNVATYERGVEDETYSCGTGTVAACITANIEHNLESPIKAITKGGELQVHFKTNNKEQYHDIWLQGPAVKTFAGIYKL